MPILDNPRLAETRDAVEIAEIHYSSLEKSFLARLGTKFLARLYRHLIEKEIIFIQRNQEGRLLGFVAASCNTKGLMKRFLFSSPAIPLNILIILLRRPDLIKRVIETALVSSKLKSKELKIDTLDLPQEEVLAIAVSADAQNQGVGSKLLESLEGRLRSFGVQRFKVIAGEKLFGANKFYKRSGFSLVGKITLHGTDVSHIYVKEI